MEILQQVKNFVDNSFNGDTVQIIHFDRTVHFVQVLEPFADEAFLVAAYAHDISRAFAKSVHFKGRFNDPTYLREHQENCARIIGDFLESIKVEKEFIARVKMLVSKHEVGGNVDQNLLKDADSLSFFENNIPFFLDVMVKKTSKDEVKEKFEWMFDRITSKKAKDIAKPWYEEAIKKLTKH